VKQTSRLCSLFRVTSRGSLLSRGWGVSSFMQALAEGIARDGRYWCELSRRRVRDGMVNANHSISPKVALG
jgi:hypothetical protein